MTLLDFTIKTIIKENLPFPKLVYLNTKLQIIKYIIKYDRVDILQCVNYSIHRIGIIRLIPKMYHWNSIKCFTYLNLHLLDTHNIYLLPEDYFAHKRFIRGYIPVKENFKITTSEAYLILLKHKNHSFIDLIIHKGITIPFNWPLDLDIHIVKRIYNHNVMKKVTRPKVCKYINHCSDIKTAKYLIKNVRTINKLLDMRGLLLKAKMEKITEKQLIHCINLRSLANTATITQIKQLKKYIDIFQIRWPKTVIFYRSRIFDYLIELNDWLYVSKAFTRIIHYVSNNQLEPSYLEKCLKRGCSVTCLYPHLTEEMVPIYVKYGGNLLNALKQLQITPQHINYKFESKKDKLEAIAYYCELGDLNTIQYIVSS